MLRALVFLAGLGGFAALGYVATSSAAVIGYPEIGGAPTRIEAELQAAAEGAIKALGFEWASVEVDGQVATVKGEAPKDEERAQARAAVLTAAGPGGLVRGGVWQVRDATTLAPPVRPFEWRATRNGQGVALWGAVPSRTVRAELLDQARRLFPGPVEDNMRIARGAPDEGAWAATARVALAQVAMLEEGRAVLKDERLMVEGVAISDEVKSAVTQAVAQPLAPFVAAVRIEAPEAIVIASPEASEDAANAADTAEITDVAVCQELFTQLNKDAKITFGSGLAVIEKESYPGLKRLAIAAKRCKAMRVVVEGHTDDSGDAEANKALSLKRAQAVADYLVLEGVEPRRVSAEGFGPERPVASNADEAGRALNRRIEFRIQT